MSFTAVAFLQSPLMLLHFSAFHISQFSSVPEAVCLPSVHHLQSQCYLPAIAQHMAYAVSFSLTLVYMAYISCM